MLLVGITALLPDERSFGQSISQPPIFNHRTTDEEEQCLGYSHTQNCSGDPCLCSEYISSDGWRCDGCGTQGQWPIFSTNYYVEADAFSCVPINFIDYPLLDLPDGFELGEPSVAPSFHIELAPVETLNRIREIPVECSPDRNPVEAAARFYLTLDGTDSNIDCSGAIFFITAEFDKTLFDVKLYGRVRSTSGSFSTSFLDLQPFQPRIIVGSEVVNSNALRYPTFVANPKYVKVGLKPGRSAREAGNQSVRLRVHSFNWGGDDCSFWPCLEGMVFQEDDAANVQVFSMELPPDWCEEPPGLGEDQLSISSLPDEQRSAAEFDGQGAMQLNQLTADLPVLKVGHCRFRVGQTLAESLGNDAYFHDFAGSANDFHRVNVFGVWCAVDDLPNWTASIVGNELKVHDPNEGLDYYYRRPGGGSLSNAPLKLATVKRSSDNSVVRTYAYSAGGVDGDLIEQADNDGNTIEYSYIVNGNDTTLTATGTAIAGGARAIDAEFTGCDQSCSLQSATWSNGGPSRRYEYSGGRISRVLDAANNVLLAFSYDSQGRLTETTRGEGQTLQVLSRQTYFLTPGNGEERGPSCMVNQCFVASNSGTPVYQATIYTFDEFNRITGKQQFHDLQTIEVVEGECDELPAFTGSSSTTTTVYRNASLGISGADLVIEEKLPSGSVSRYMAYDLTSSGHSNLLRSFLAIPNITSISGQTLIHEKQYTYTTSGGIPQISTEKDVARDNAQTSYAYSSGFLTSRTHPSISGGNSGSGAAIPPQVETFTYDANNKKLITAETQKNGSNQTISISNTYDAYAYPAMRTESVANCDSHTASTEYNAFGRLTKQTDADGFVTVHAYELDGHPNDGSGLLLAQYTYASGDSGPVVQETRYFYYTSGPNLGRLERIDLADHEGSFTFGAPAGWQQTTFEYDVYGRIVEKTTTHTTKPGSFAWQYFYDLQNRIAQIVFPGGTWIRTVRDGRSHVINELVGYGGSGGEGGTTVLTNTYAYDANGNLIERLNQTASELPDHTTYEYDIYDRRTKRSDEDDGSVGYDIVANYEYNAGEDVVREYIQQGSGGSVITDIRRDFDELGRAWKETILKNPPNLSGTQDRITTITYNVTGNEVARRITNGTTDHAETTWAFTCLDHPQSKTEKLTSSTNAVTTYETDERGNLTAVTDPLLNRTENDYDALGRRTETRYFERVASNDILQLKDQIAWTSREQQARQTRLSASGIAIDQQRWEYDLLGFIGRAARMADPDSTSAVSTSTDRVLDMAHDALGRELERTAYADGVARTTARSYDEIGRLESILHPIVEDFESLTYYANSTRVQLRTIQDGIGVRTMTMAYDPFARVESETAEGTEPDIVTSYVHDAANRRVSMTDPLGIVTQYSYDGIGQLVQVVEDLGGANERVTAFSFSQKGDLLTATADDGEGPQVTTYTYDRAGRRLTRKHADNSQQVFAYDAAHRMTTRQAEDNFITFYNYNWRAEIVQKRQTNSTGTILEEFTFDPQGRMTAASVGPLSSATYKTTYVYGDGTAGPAFVDEPISETQVVNGISKTLTYSHNTAGERTGLVYPTGANTTLEFTQDPYGQILRIDRNEETLVKYAYAGRYPTSRQVRTTFGPSERWVEMVWDRPDQVRRPSGISNRLRVGSTNGVGGTLITRISYTSVFDAVGNLDTQTASGHPITSENGTLNHSYDRLHRLTASDYPNSTNDESWALDELSNWTSHSDREGNTQTYTDNNLNQYTGISGQVTAPLHDAKGNIVRNEREYGFTHDFENRLTRVFTDDSPSNGQYDTGETVHAEFVVDAMGRRVQAMIGGQTTYRFYDRTDVLLAEFPSSSPNSPSATFINGATSIDEKILAIDGSGTELYYVLKDLDTVAAVIDASGAYVEAYAYSGYGLPTIASFVAPCERGDFNADGSIDGQDIQIFENVLLGNDTDPGHLCAADFDGDNVVDMADVPDFTVCLLYQLCPPGPTSSFENPFLFTGQRLDWLASGDLLLYDYKARAFDPVHGRFLQRDPVEFADSYNLYEYVQSRPTVFVDPTGEFSIPQVNIGMAIRSGLQALNWHGALSKVWDVAKQLRAGVDVRQMLVGLVVEAVLDRLGGKLFDAATGALGKFTGHTLRELKRAFCCFVAGTRIHTTCGEVDIEGIQVGDLVWSRYQNDAAAQIVQRPVAGIYVREAPYVIWLTFSNGTVLGATPEHLVWTFDRGWVFVGELCVGDRLLSASGESCALEDKVTDWTPRATYNFEVSDTATYFANGIWVHNTSCDFIKSILTNPKLTKGFVESLETQAAQSAGATGVLSIDAMNELWTGLQKQGYKLKIPGSLPDSNWVGGLHVNILGPGGNSIHLPCPSGWTP